MVELGKSTEVHFVVLLAQLCFFFFSLLLLLVLTHDLSHQCQIPGC